MSWVHPIANGLIACGFGVISFTFWRSLAQEMKLGKVDDLRWQAARILGASLFALIYLWEAIASPKAGSAADYIRWALIILAIAAFTYGMRGRRPAGLR
jgi:hypothetical protein